MRRFIRNSHKYVSLAVSIQLLLWTVSGLFFAFNKIQEVRGEHVMTRGVFAANVSDFAVDVSEAKSIRILSRLDSPSLFSQRQKKPFTLIKTVQAFLNYPATRPWLWWLPKRVCNL